MQPSPYLVAVQEAVAVTVTAARASGLWAHKKRGMGGCGGGKERVTQAIASGAVARAAAVARVTRSALYPLHPAFDRVSVNYTP